MAKFNVPGTLVRMVSLLLRRLTLPLTMYVHGTHQRWIS